MKKIILSLAMCSLPLLMAALLWSCSSDGDDSGNNKPAPTPTPVEGTHVVTEENRVVKEGDVTVTMPASAIGEQEQITIKKSTTTTPVLGADRKGVVLDVSMGDQHDINGIVEIKVPYKVSDASNQLGVGYYNESSKEWEPVDWDYESGNVVINTDHFSKYGIFEIKYENTASANLISICETSALFGSTVYESTLPIQAFVKLSQSDGTVAKTMDVLADAYGTGNQFINDFGYNSIKALGFDTAIDGWMDKYGQNFSYVGFAFTMWQVSRQVHEGKNKEAFQSIIDATTTNLIGIMGTVFGAPFSVVGLAAYLVSKYVINSFFEGVISGRKDEYVQAYDLYLKDHPRYYKDWYKLIYSIVTDDKLNEAEMSEAIDTEVNNYCYAFWKDYTTVLEYYTQATGKSMGAGMSDTEVYKNMQKEISENRRGQIYNNVIPQVMTEINGKMREKNFETYKTEFLKFRDMLNKPFTLNFVDGNLKGEKSKLQGYKVKFAELPKNIEDSKNWECTLNKSGKGSIKLTVFAYIKNKMQPKMILVDKDGKTVKELEFVPNPPTNTITIDADIQEDEDKEVAQLKKEIIGEWTYKDHMDLFNIEMYASYIALQFNEDGTYEEVSYSGTRNDACTVLYCETKHLANAGTYTIYRSEKDNWLYLKMETTMDDNGYSFEKYTNTDWLVPFLPEKVTNPVLRVKNDIQYVHQCTGTKLYLGHLPIYKDIWKRVETTPDAPQ